MNKSPPSKIFKLRKWLALPDVAKHFSVIYGEEVTEADILRWALDGYLKLSVYFENPAYGALGSLEENAFPKYYPKATWDNERQYANFLKLVAERLGEYDFVANENNRVDKLYGGVFDLPMVGGEWDYIEQKWKELDSGPNDISTRLEEIIIKDCKGNVFALQEVEFFDEDAHLLSGENYSPELMDKLRRSRYYPAVSLPSDSILVVRAEAIRDCERLIDEPDIPATSTEPLHNDPDKSTLLRALNQASLLWRNADRDDKTTWTDTKEVVAFLIENGFSPTLAVRGASIVRPDWAESGRIPKE